MSFDTEIILLIFLFNIAAGFAFGLHDPHSTGRKVIGWFVTIFWMLTLLRIGYVLYAIVSSIPIWILGMLEFSFLAWIAWRLGAWIAMRFRFDFLRETCRQYPSDMRLGDWLRG